MIFPSNHQVFLSCEPVDMRKAIDGLSILVADALGKDPLSASIFLFRNKRGDKLKILYWDTNGFCLWYKRLEKGKFKFPQTITGEMSITMAQLRWLLDGLDFQKLKGHKTLSYQKYF